MAELTNILKFKNGYPFEFPQYEIPDVIIVTAVHSHTNSYHILNKDKTIFCRAYLVPGISVVFEKFTVNPFPYTTGRGQTVAMSTLVDSITFLPIRKEAGSEKD